MRQRSRILFQQVRLRIQETRVRIEEVRIMRQRSPVRKQEASILLQETRSPLRTPCPQNLNVYCNTGNMANWFQVLMVLVR